MRLMATSLFALLILAAPVLATTPDILINGGTMDFLYNEVPGGSINGTFGSSGSLVADPPDQGTAATTYELNGLNYATVVGAVDDGANFIDGGVIVVSDAAPIAVGTYPFDMADGWFFFVDDAVGWVPPADLWNTNWTLELASISAAGKYGSMSGSVTFTSVSSTLIAGTFTATVIDPGTGTTLAISSGEFNVETTTAVDASSWGGVKELYR
jgi:hypothetical protein